MRILLNIIFLFSALSVFAQDNSHYLYYSLEGFNGNTAVLFSIKGSENIALDTVKKQSTGAFVFQNIEKYPAGMYSVYFNDSLYTEVILNNEDVIIRTDIRNIVKYMKIQKSIENTILFDYWNFALIMRDSITDLSFKRNKIEQATYNSNHPDIIEIDKKIVIINNSLYTYVHNMKKEFPDKFAPKLLQSYMFPSFDKYQKENPNNQYKDEKSFYYDHFFDNIDFSDKRFVQTKVLFVSISDYMKTFGKPASTVNYIGIIDNVMKKASSNIFVYRYCLNLFMQTFENSIWEDVFVHLIDNYYLTSSVENPQLGNYYAGLSNRIKSLKPGKLAPNIILKDTSGNNQSLYSLSAKAKLIVFYSTECTHCAESMPALVEIYNMYKEQGLEAYGIALTDSASIWKKEIKTFKMNWINLSDLRGLRSPIIQTYNITSTPEIIILNKDNYIMYKPKNMEEIHATLVQLLN